MLKVFCAASASLLAAAAIAGECASQRAACDESTSGAPRAVYASYNAAEKNIVETAVAAGSFNTLAVALKAAGLVDTLSGKGPFTVFAPTDEAFAKLPKGTLETLLKPENKGLLTSILTYHVVPGSVMAKDVVSLKNAATVNGQRVDIKAEGGKVMVDAAKVTKTDIECSNGVIHVIDSVILPADKDVIDTAVAAGQFKTLATAIEAAGLISTLKGNGPFTVLAPTDEAFAKLPPGTVENLLKPENRQALAEVLTYHVIPGRVYADQALSAKTARTVLGQTVAFSSGPGGAMVNNAKIVKTDIDSKNGVIHVIDTVIMPKK